MGEKDLEKEINDFLDTSLLETQMKKVQEEEAKTQKMIADKKADLIPNLKAMLEEQNRLITEAQAKKQTISDQLKAIEALNRDDRTLKRKSHWPPDNCDTISCMELDMKHDGRGRVKDWMEDESRSDNWTD